MYTDDSVRIVGLRPNRKCLWTKLTDCASINHNVRWRIDEFTEDDDVDDDDDDDDDEILEIIDSEYMNELVDRCAGRLILNRWQNSVCWLVSLVSFGAKLSYAMRFHHKFD